MNNDCPNSLRKQGFCLYKCHFCFAKCLLGCAQSPSSGIWIHGGDPAPTSSKGLPRYPLRPTYGCVRVTNGDQLVIQNVLNNQSQKTGVLEIIERDT